MEHPSKRDHGTLQEGRRREQGAKGGQGWRLPERLLGNRRQRYVLCEVCTELCKTIAPRLRDNATAARGRITQPRAHCFAISACTYFAKYTALSRVRHELILFEWTILFVRCRLWHRQQHHEIERCAQVHNILWFEEIWSENFAIIVWSINYRLWPFTLYSPHEIFLVNRGFLVVLKLENESTHSYF